MGKVVKEKMGLKRKSSKKEKNGKQIKKEPKSTPCSITSFSDFGLDDRILKSIGDCGWSTPTLIQQHMIPLALEGKDVLARARTGSGKTAAFAIPIIQKILEANVMSGQKCTRALILTPTKELAEQVTNHISDLCSSCSREVTFINIAEQSDLQSQKTLLSEQPDIVVCTPSRVLHHMENGLKLESLEFVVIDEADLLFSFGHEQDTIALFTQLPKVYQALLTSATLNDQVLSLKKLVLRNAVTLKLEEAQLPHANQLTQFHIRCSEEDKFVLLYSLLKLKLIRGKSIIFVNCVDRCYRLKLFLQQFGISTCVLNAQLPINSRCHIVDQFNQGIYTYLIATDTTAHETEAPDQANEETTEKVPTTEKKDKCKKWKTDNESGVSRGIDFHRVSNVLNFDFPKDVHSYIHRVGRTARGWNKGTAMSFCAPDEWAALQEVEEVLHQQGGVDSFRPYQFRMEELDGFRYRARDAMRAVTNRAVREARLEEIKGELLKARKLKAYFAENPRDLKVLRHDKALHTVKVTHQLTNVPEYIVPPSLRGSAYSDAPKTKKRKKEVKVWKSEGQKKYEKKKSDPLLSFDMSSDED